MAVRKIGKSKIFPYLLLTIILAINISACSSNDIKSNKSPSSLANTHEEKEDIKREATVRTFNLGSVDKEKYSYNVQGVIGAPNKGENYPIVVIMHGANKKNQAMTQRYDEGFSYLVEALAQKGYLALSIDVSEQYNGEYGKYNDYNKLQDIYNIHLNKLAEAIEGNIEYIGIDMKNKGNLSSINLIGEGESAQGIYYIADNEEISSVMLVSPINNQAYNIELKDVPTAIVIPELDGVTSSLDGQDIYDILKNNDSRKSWTSLVYINKGNHNYFNTAFESDDSIYINQDKDSKIKTKDSKVEVINPFNQREFLINYTLDFLSSSIQSNPRGAAFRIDKKTTNQLYGVDVQTRLDIKEKSVVVKPHIGEDINNSFLIGNYIPTNIKANGVRESCIPTDDTAGPFKQPGKPKALSLLQLEWVEKGSKIEVSLPKGAEKLLKGAKSLNISMAVDSSNKLNKANSSQVMSIIIGDKDGKRQRLTLADDQPALQYKKGELLSYENVKVWSNYTPISDIRIPFSEFNNIDINEVVSIAIEFDGTDSGSIMIEGVAIYI